MEVNPISDDEVAKIVKNLYDKDVQIAKDKSYRKDGTLETAICYVISKKGKAAIVHHFKSNESTDFVEVELNNSKKEFRGKDCYIEAETYAMGEI